MLPSDQRIRMPAQTRLNLLGRCIAQKYGPGALKGMLAWLRHLAAAVGTAEILTEALGDCEEEQEYQQVRPAAASPTARPNQNLPPTLKHAAHSPPVWPRCLWHRAETQS